MWRERDSVGHAKSGLPPPARASFREPHEGRWGRGAPSRTRTTAPKGSAIADAGLRRLQAQHDTEAATRLSRPAGHAGPVGSTSRVSGSQAGAAVRGREPNTLRMSAADTRAGL